MTVPQFNFQTKLTSVLLVALFVTVFVMAPVRDVRANQVLPDIVGHWAEDDLRLLYHKGVINGFPDGTFRPEGNITRAQLAKLVVEAKYMGDEAAVLAGTVSRFDDVTRDHWALGYIEVAAELEVVEGYPDQRFGPDRPISRAELVVMIVRALGRVSDGAPTQVTLPYVDANEIPAWAREAIASAYSAGMLEGYADTYFEPTRFASRAHAGLLIKQLLGRERALYDFTGFMVSASDHSMRLLVAEQQLDLAISQVVEVFLDGKKADAATLEPLQELAIVLDEDGKAAFVNAFEATREAQIHRVSASERSLGLRFEASDEVIDYRVATYARIFRNGRPAVLADLTPGDHLLVALSRFDRQLVLLDASHYDVEGSLLEMGPSILRLKTDAGETLGLGTSADTIYFLNGSPVDASSLQQGDRLQVALGGEGMTLYVNAYREERE